MHDWNLIMPQVELQLLSLGQSNANPNISAYAYLYGPHNYNAKQFVPIVMEMLIHRKTQQEEDLWPTLCEILGIGNFNGELSILGPMDDKNEGKNSVRYRVY